MRGGADIVVVGSSNTDMVIRVTRIPRPGETVLGEEFFTAAGGKGANQAVAAARAGGTVRLVARVGCDSFGDEAIRGFQAEGIDVALVSRDRNISSGAALIFVDGRGQNAIAVAGGANFRLRPSDVKRASPAIRRAKVLLMQLETSPETVLAAARIGRSAGLTVILNPAPARRLSDELLAQVSILTPNETEAEMLSGVKITGIRKAVQAARKLLLRGVPAIILTLGSRGALIATAEGMQQIPAFTVKAVDTTAAGDVFNGALAVALTENRPLGEGVRFANAAAALSVTRQGAQHSAPVRREIDRLLAMQ